MEPWDGLEGVDSRRLGQILVEFVEKNGSVFCFEFLEEGNRREKLWSVIFAELEKPTSPIWYECLSAVRILSRDKEGLDSLATRSRVGLLRRLGGLAEPRDSASRDPRVELEALKCSCNILYNVSSVRGLGSEEVTESAVKFGLSRKPTGDILLFQVKLLFLVTALDPPCRIKLRDEELGGLELLCALLEESRREDGSAKLCCEILKTLFNVLLPAKGEEDECEEGTVSKETLNGLVLTLREILTNGEELSSNSEVLSDVVNLLTVVPPASLKVLGLGGVDKIVQFLDETLSRVESGRGSPRELLSPLLASLIKMAGVSGSTRKHLRVLILPKLRDVSKRPEEGDTLRNKLCRLLTSPVSAVAELAADLLFILCKESVGRMVKYTGYGNSAGLFARRGLLGRSVQYSSDSSESETEEYRRDKGSVDPVLGCKTSSRPDPLRGLSDEQKESLALELVGRIDALQREGLIRPCRVGEDGKPVPIEHVLQLREEASKQCEQFNSDSE